MNGLGSVSPGLSALVYGLNQKALLALLKNAMRPTGDKKQLLKPTSFEVDCAN